MSSSPLPPDYAQRASQLDFATPERVRTALDNPETVVLDVRSPEEVQSTGHLHHPTLVTTHCHACPQFDKIVQEMAPEKNDATIVIYCKSGRRANVAKEQLIGLGYKKENILNAGGLEDVLAIIGQD